VPAAALLLSLAALAPAPEPLGWQEPGALSRLFLQVPLEAPAVLPAGRWGGDLRLLYASQLLLGDTAALHLDVDLESAQLMGRVRVGLPGGVEARLTVPVLLDWGGFLDRPIEWVERNLRATNPWRFFPGRVNDTARFRLGPSGGGGLDRRGGLALGDLQAGAKVALVAQDGARPALALRAAVKAPTGSPTFGSGTTDLGAGLLAAWALPPLAVHLALDGAAPLGAARVGGVSARPFWSAQAGLAAAAGERFALHLQLSGHQSPLRGSGISQIDKPTFYLLLGMTAALPRGLALEVGVVENVWSPHWGADITLLLGLRSR
jgi:hypothetical protein